jgi:hypothetical protein
MVIYTPLQALNKNLFKECVTRNKQCHYLGAAYFVFFKKTVEERALHFKVSTALPRQCAGT